MRTFAPPPASSWATPPEFYLDENLVTRRVKRFLLQLGYLVHTPGELFGTNAEARGSDDTEWLSRLAGSEWAVLGRDLKILARKHELDAYRRARLHMFLLPGEALAAELVAVLAFNLQDVCSATSSRVPSV